MCKKVSGGSWRVRDSQEGVGVLESLRREFVCKRVSGGSLCVTEY